jgi:hypothetical protein
MPRSFVKLRETLRKVPWIAAINARIKDRATRAEYRAVTDHYRLLPRRDVPLPRLDRAAPRPRVLFVGTDEQQDRSGILQALERLTELTLFTRADGGYGHNDPRPAAVRRRANGERLDAIVDELASRDATPHLILAQTWATLMDPAALDRARRRGCLVANISMDDRHQFRGRREAGCWSGTLGLAGHIDLALTAARECVEWYQKEGCPALYFPEASDPEIFHPMPGLPKIHQVSFVGVRYGIREEIVGALRRAGIRVSAYGSGWEAGRIPTEDVSRLFAQSKIVLGVGTIGHCRDFYALKLRDFDGPMSGSLYVTHDNTDLHELFAPGKEIVLYRDVADCVAKVRDLLSQDRAREAIAAAGRARAVRDHTWQGRFSHLFELLSRENQRQTSTTS